jgi:hypothetical protein
LPVPVAKLCREAWNDPDLRDARGTVVLMEARVRQLMQRLSTPETLSLWGDLRQAAEKLVAAAQEPDLEARCGAMLLCAQRILELSNQAAADEETWKQLERAEFKKLAAQKAEWKRLRDLRQLATTEEVLGLVRAIAESVRRHVSNPRERLAVANDIFRLTREEKGPDPEVN